MPFDANLADRVQYQLAQRPECRGEDLVVRKMFGGLGLLLRGNMCVGVWRSALIVRVGPDAYAAALDAPHARPFDITGRPMRGWVMVDADGVDSDADLSAWIARAVDFVATLPAK